MIPEEDREHLRDSCSDCQKLIFPSKRDAQGVLNSMRKRLRRGRRVTRVSIRQAKTKKIPHRIYPCPVGNGWHVTSQVRGEDKTRRRDQQARRRRREELDR